MGKLGAEQVLVRMGVRFCGVECLAFGYYLYWFDNISLWVRFNGGVR